jgi:predicted MFS family arabinose efflux permease
MSLWSVAFQGSTAVGGPLVGGIVALFGARAALLVGSLTCFAAAGIAASVLRRPRPLEATP